MARIGRILVLIGFIGLIFYFVSNEYSNPISSCGLTVNVEAKSEEIRCLLEKTNKPNLNDAISELELHSFDPLLEKLLLLSIEEGSIQAKKRLAHIYKSTGDTMSSLYKKTRHPEAMELLSFDKSAIEYIRVVNQIHYYCDKYSKDNIYELVKHYCIPLKESNENDHIQLILDICKQYPHQYKELCGP